MYAVAAIGVMVACSRASCFEESGMGTSAPGFILIGVRSLATFRRRLSRSLSDVENAAIALERALEFTHGLPQEAPHSRAADAALPPGWPAGAALVFTNLSLRYAPELPPSLVAMSLAVRAGERVGIVGRSGAGKSTVLAALLRLVEGESGGIRLAGIDVTMVGLGTLRRARLLSARSPRSATARFASTSTLTARVPTTSCGSCSRRAGSMRSCACSQNCLAPRRARRG